MVDFLYLLGVVSCLGCPWLAVVIVQGFDGVVDLCECESKVWFCRREREEGKGIVVCNI